MGNSVEQSSVLDDAARAAIGASDFVGALALLEQSLEGDIHAKTLELIGEVRCRLGRQREDISPQLRWASHFGL